MSDRALRRLAVKLSRNRREDVDAVLAALDPAHRSKITALLAGSAGPAEGEPRSVSARQASSRAADLEDFSPWLAIRIRAAAGEGGEGRISLAPAASDALRALASAPPSTEGKAHKRAADLLRSLGARIRGMAA